MLRIKQPTTFLLVDFPQKRLGLTPSTFRKRTVLARDLQAIVGALPAQTVDSRILLRSLIPTET
jgi:hypothetical protein